MDGVPPTSTPARRLDKPERQLGLRSHVDRFAREAYGVDGQDSSQASGSCNSFLARRCSGGMAVIESPNLKTSSRPVFSLHAVAQFKCISASTTDARHVLHCVKISIGREKYLKKSSIANPRSVCVYQPLFSIKYRNHHEFIPS